MRVTSTLYVTDHRAHIRLRRGTLIVEQATGWQRVPIETLDGVVLTGRAEISNDALGELVRRHVRVAAISKTGRLRFVVGGPVSGNVHLRIAQVSASMNPSVAASVARWVVAGKLQNCRRTMKRWSWDEVGGIRRAIELQIDAVGERIHALAGTSDGDKIRGIEGDGSRRYFVCLGMHLAGGEGSMSFARRSRRPPRDPVNALLSFMYGLVLTELVGALDAVGLDPQIGFLHRPRSGRPSLALDLLEEFRPAVADRFATAALGRCQVRDEHFKVTGGAYYLNDEGRATVLGLYEEYRSEEVPHSILGHRVGRWALPTIQATLLARYLRGDLPAYPPFVMAP